MGRIVSAFIYLSILIGILAVLLGGIWNSGYREDFSFRVIEKLLFSQFNRGYFCVHLRDGSIRRYGSNPYQLQSGINEARCDASMTIYSDSFFSHLLMNAGTTGLGESYMREEWNSTTSDLHPVLYYIIDNVVHSERGFFFKILKNISPMEWYNYIQYTFLNRSIEADQSHIDFGYAIGNDFFQRLLETATMTYTCAIFKKEDVNNLVLAQYNKYEIISNKLNIDINSTNLHILEIGGGWGGFANYLQNKTKSKVTSINIAQPQIDFSNNRYGKNNRKLNYIKLDYRNIVKEFGLNSMDRIVSIGCLEHTGYRQQLLEFFELTWKVLKPGQRMVLHFISKNNIFPQWNDFSKIRCKYVTFIDQYIFPGSCTLLPDYIHNVADSVGWKLIHQENFGQHYMKTLKEWRNKWELKESKEYIYQHYDEKLYKAYQFGTALAEASFRIGIYDLTHMIFIKPDVDNPYQADMHYYDEVFV